MDWKILPPDEWHRIKAELPDSPLAALEHFDQMEGVVIVVEQDGKLVGHWPLILTWHAEPLYLDPAYRKSGPALKHLLEGLFTTMRQTDIASALVIIEDPELQAAGARLGFQPVPGALYIATATAPPAVRT
jgi:hypothetical protein